MKMKNPCENCICLPICISVYKTWFQNYFGFLYQNTIYIRNVAVHPRFSDCGLLRTYIIEGANLGSGGSVLYLHEVNDMFRL